MEAIKIYLAVITFILIWTTIYGKVLAVDNETIVYKHNKYKKLIKLIDFKPINCKLCLSFWIGIILTICLNDLIYLSLPLTFLTILK